jgi:hypothetical protein
MSFLSGSKNEKVQKLTHGFLPLLDFDSGGCCFQVYVVARGNSIYCTWFTPRHRWPGYVHRPVDEAEIMGD